MDEEQLVTVTTWEQFSVPDINVIKAAAMAVGGWYSQYSDSMFVPSANAPAIRDICLAEFGTDGVRTDEVCFSLIIKKATEIESEPGHYNAAIKVGFRTLISSSELGARLGTGVKIVGGEIFQHRDGHASLYVGYRAPKDRSGKIIITKVPRTVAEKLKQEFTRDRCSSLGSFVKDVKIKRPPNNSKVRSPLG